MEPRGGLRACSAEDLHPLLVVWFLIVQWGMLKIDVQPWALGPRWCAKGGRDPDVSRGGAAQPHESTK